MKLYICYGTFGGEHHACARADAALREAGYEPEVIKTYGCYGTDRFFSGRREVKDMTGNFKVPTLVLDDGTVVDESQKIVDWAGSHPAEPQATVNA
jgi:glutathione S-transferase